MARPVVAVAASSTSSCRVCCGAGRVEVRALPVGDWVPMACPHCRPAGVPYFPLRPLPEPKRNPA